MSNGKKKGYIHGGKFSVHGRVTESARKIAETVSKYPEVKSISNGTIIGKGPSQFSIKFEEIHGGWRIKVYGSHAMQKLHVYTRDPTQTREKLELKFLNNLR